VAKAETMAAMARAEAAKAEEEAAKAAREVAKSNKARDEAEEKSSVRELAEKAAEKGVEEGSKKAVEGAIKTIAENPLPLLRYLIAIPAIMLGAILFLAGIIGLLEPPYNNDAETLAAIRRDLEKAATKFITTGERPGEWLKL
jgi:hypothetical protein